MLYQVSKMIVHPNYAHDNFNDVALLKTRRKMEFGNQVGPACLPFQHSPDTFAGSFVQLLGKYDVDNNVEISSNISMLMWRSGWGTTSFGGPPSDILQKVTVSVLTNLQCSKFYPDLTPQQICTYAEDKDACQVKRDKFFRKKKKKYVTNNVFRDDLLFINYSLTNLFIN